MTSVLPQECFSGGLWYIQWQHTGDTVNLNWYNGTAGFSDVRFLFLPGTSYHAIVNTLRPRQNGRHFADDMFKCIFVNENFWIPIEISLKFVPKGPFNNIPALDQLMAWRRPGDKPLSEPMMVRLPTHICVTRPQWVNTSLEPTVETLI